MRLEQSKMLRSCFYLKLRAHSTKGSFLSRKRLEESLLRRYRWEESRTSLTFTLSLSPQSVFLQDNVISQIRQLDLSVLTHLHYLYLQVINTRTQQ